ncbi:MAG TPA: PQQ-binding-like beta-propeller repeat protein [Cyclobacteriaceae bacterium]|nr:PQQ-binding-like beta-propeller repeat protein [Cyclobacteriaceae bacterium]
MKKSKLSLILIGLLVYSAVQEATSQNQEAWSSRVGSLEWMHINSLGYLVVRVTGSLKALDPQTGELIWEDKTRGTLRADQLEDIFGTKYMKISYGTDELDGTLPMIAIVDVITGKTVFDSRQEKLGVLGSYALPGSGRFLVVGVQPGKFSAKLVMYNMETGAKLWENEEIFKGESGKGGVLGKMAGAVQSLMNMQSLTSAPLEIDNEHVLITHPNYVIKLKSADGSTVWRTKIEESTRAELIFSTVKPNVVFVGAETESESMMSSGSGPPPMTYMTNYYAFDINTGASVWAKPIRNSNERLNIVIPMEKGILIMPGMSGNMPRTTLNFIDYNTGATTWGTKGRGIKADGTVIDYLYSEHGIVISTEAVSANQNKGENYFLNILDVENATLRFDKSVKTNGRLVSTELISKGIMFITTHEVNIVDPKTGSVLLPNPIESGGPKRMDKTMPFPFTSFKDKLYVFSTKEGIVKELDKTNGNVRSLNSAKLELGGKEVPKYIDAYDEGVVLSSDQNIVMIGYDGLLKFNSYFPPPRQSGIMRAFALAEAIKGVYIGAVMAAASVTYAGISASTDDKALKQAGTGAALVTGGIAAYSFAYTGKALADFNRRFKATTMADDYLIVLSEVAPRDFRLLQVDKRTGKTIATFDIGKDRDPFYSLDFIDHQIYYQSRPSEITCFKLTQ